MAEKLDSPILIKAPSSGFLLRTAIWLGLIGLLIYFLVTIRVTLTIFGLGWFIAYLMNPLVKRLEGHRLGPIPRCSRGVVVFVIYLVLGVMVVVIGSFALPEVVAQLSRVSELQKSLDPQKLTQIVQTQSDKLIQMVPQAYRETVLVRLHDSVDTISAELGKFATRVVAYLGSFFGEMVAGAFLFLSAVVVSLYMIMNWRGMGESVVNIFPQEYKLEIKALLREMNAIFGGYMRATILTSLACSALTLASLLLYSWATGRNCPYTYLISFIAGITYPIPILGILATTVIAAILGYIPEGDFSNGFWVGMIVLVMNNILDRTLQPIMMSGAIGVSPLFVIFAAAAGGEFLGGVAGMLLGIPIAAMAKVLIIWIYERFLRTSEKPTTIGLAAGELVLLSPPYPSSTSIVVSTSGPAPEPTTSPKPLAAPIPKVAESPDLKPGKELPPA